MDKKKLGIIGGMGPLATAYFYEKIIERTEASCDQDHIVTYITSSESMLNGPISSPAGTLRPVSIAR